MSSLDPLLLTFVELSFITLSIGLILRYFKQPSVIAYIIAGVIIGPFGLKVISDGQLISRLGDFGVVLLLFFVGMEIPLKDLISKWKIAIIGTALQIFLSLGFIAILGYFINWSLGRIVLIGFVISLSSTAVVFKILESKNEFKSKMGRDIISILLVQDLAIIPMMIIISSLSGEQIELDVLGLQIVGFIASLLLIWWLYKKGNFKLPFFEKLKEDSELQVLSSLVICFGIASISGLFHISTALGAFIAGIFLSSAKEVEWVHHNLISFKVIFLALFFISIGLLIDLNFLFENWAIVFSVLFLVFFTNTLINAIIFKISGETWQKSFYGGSILSQVGEFSFILVAVGLSTGIIADFTYKLTILVIALSLLVSPFWISFFSRFVNRSALLVKKGDAIIKKINKKIVS